MGSPTPNPEADAKTDPWNQRFDRLESAVDHLQKTVEVVILLADHLTRQAEVNLSKPSKGADSPYLTKEEAAEYLRTTVDGIYGRVERGRLERCPGVRDYLFTKEMLDDSAMGRFKKAGPENAGPRRSRKKGAS
jgi:hypothetical protein